MQHHPAPSPAPQGREGEGAAPHRFRTTRRRALAAAFAFLATALAPRPGLAAALHRHLPPGLDPAVLGAALRVAHPTCTTADCLARAALPNPADLPARAAADFAAGRTLAVNGWILSETEAWLCAALT